MTEGEALERAKATAPQAMDALQHFAELLIAENAKQNLISQTTEALLWSRHLFDALQLTAFARSDDRSWLDVGTGPGLPGIVLAIVSRWQMTLVEPRKRRVAFLESVVDALQLRNVTLQVTTGEKITGRYDLVSARAVSSVDGLLAMTRGCTDESTRFVLPKGRSAWSDVDEAKARWHGLFHVEHSLTDPTAGIVVADRVRRR